MIRSGEGCIREDMSNYLVHTDFLLPLVTETTIEKGMFEGHCHGRSHLIHCFKTTLFISYTFLKVISSAELHITDTTRWHFIKWL